MVIFFFKQKTAYEMRISDWSSDVCSSDLNGIDRTARMRHRPDNAPRRTGRSRRGYCPFSGSPLARRCVASRSLTSMWPWLAIEGGHPPDRRSEARLMIKTPGINTPSRFETKSRQDRNRDGAGKSVSIQGEKGGN